MQNNLKYDICYSAPLLWINFFSEKERKEEIFIQLVLDVIRYFLGEVPEVLTSPQIKKTYWKIDEGFATYVLSLLLT